MFKWMVGPCRMNDYGAGYDKGPSNPSKPVYFYMILDSNQASAVSDADIQSFYKTGVNTSKEFRFILVDIATDKRLEHDLSQYERGRFLLNDLQYQTPSFVISDGPLNRIDQTRHVHLTKIENYDQDFEIIFERMGLPKRKTRRLAIQFLKSINNWLELKPNIAGIGVNLNAMIGDAIKSLERNIP